MKVDKGNRYMKIWSFNITSNSTDTEIETEIGTTIYSINKSIKNCLQSSALKYILVTILLTVFFTPSEGLAQRFPAQSTKTPGPRRQLATIVFCGLGGAVLGLSTLSFYSRPQEKLSNIGIGAAIGIIVGATYTTYQAATRPYVGAVNLERELQMLENKREFFSAQIPPVTWTQTWEF